MTRSGHDSNVRLAALSGQQRQSPAAENLDIIRMATKSQHTQHLSLPSNTRADLAAQCRTLVRTGQKVTLVINFVVQGLQPQIHAVRFCQFNGRAQSVQDVAAHFPACHPRNRVACARDGGLDARRFAELDRAPRPGPTRRGGSWRQ